MVGEHDSQLSSTVSIAAQTRVRARRWLEIEDLPIVVFTLLVQNAAKEYF